MIKRTIFTAVLALFTSYSAVATANDNYVVKNVPAYRISDTDVKILIRQMNNIEQCIYPELGKEGYEKIYENWKLEDTFAMRFYQDKILESLIGLENFAIWMQDKASQDFFFNKVNQFNHQVANVDPERCEEFKLEYQQRLEQARELISQYPNK
ncbi:DUF5358 family protein [Glaesserella sp.]|uniref:DUF5358 family protein n=1 Tax=Glaesserella sp. TaxID=2094731 RepID=UPI0035A12865